MTHTVWTRKDRRIYDFSTCLICGHAYGVCSGEPKAHRPAKCRACGSLQCWTHGLARGQCSICYIGLLDAFSEHRCGYAGCDRTAVAAVPRVKYACDKHLARAKRNGKAADTYIMNALADRPKYWEEITFDMDAMPKL